MPFYMGTHRYIQNVYMGGSGRIVKSYGSERREGGQGRSQQKTERSRREGGREGRREVAVKDIVMYIESWSGWLAMHSWFSLGNSLET